MNTKIFSRILSVFLALFLFSNYIFGNDDSLLDQIVAGEKRQIIVCANNSDLIKSIKGYSAVQNAADAYQAGRERELQQKFPEIDALQNEVKDLQEKLKKHEDDIDYVDPATGETLTTIQTQLTEKKQVISAFQQKVQEFERDIREYRANLMSPIIGRYKSIIDAFVEEMLRKHNILYIILDKSSLSSDSYLSIDITRIIADRIREDNKRREEKIKNDEAVNPQEIA